MLDLIATYGKVELSGRALDGGRGRRARASCCHSSKSPVNFSQNRRFRSVRLRSQQIAGAGPTGNDVQYPMPHHRRQQTSEEQSRHGKEHSKDARAEATTFSLIEMSEP